MIRICRVCLFFCGYHPHLCPVIPCCYSHVSPGALGIYLYIYWVIVQYTLFPVHLLLIAVVLNVPVLLVVGGWITSVTAELMCLSLDSVESTSVLWVLHLVPACFSYYTKRDIFKVIEKNQLTGSSFFQLNVTLCVLKYNYGVLRRQGKHYNCDETFPGPNSTVFIPHWIQNTLLWRR